MNNLIPANTPFPAQLPRTVTAALYLLGTVFSLLLFLKNAWIAEDAFIILRSVDQFLLGNGFRWNPHERVQVYTSPLWYLLVIASTAFCKTLYLNLVALSLLLHAALLLVMAVLIRHVGRWLAAVLLLTLSQAFFDFTASGLEYPLIYLLVGSFVLLYLRNRHQQDRYWLALCSGLALVTRHDLLFILTPMLLHLFWSWLRTLSRQQLLAVASVFIAPLACWTVFSLVYYGLPFPNTAYAKLGISGVSRLDRLERGWIYLSISLKIDPITPLLIAIATIQGFSSRQLRFAVIAASLLLAFCYITWIGADYMAGRFYVPLYLVAVLSLCCFPWRQPALSRPLAVSLAVSTVVLVYQLVATNPEPVVRGFTMLALPVPSPGQFLSGILLLGVLLGLTAITSTAGRLPVAILFAVLLAISTQLHDSPWRTGYRDWGKVTDFDMWWNLNNVSRERYFIYHWTSLYAWWHRDPARPFPDHPWCHEGSALPRVALISLAGIMPYCMGTDRIAVDVKALTDPLLPRMPKSPEAPWLSGGVNRIVPAGYLASLESSENRIEDPDLAQYYSKLLVLTQGEPLLSAERLQTIAAFNLGRYEPLLQAYRSRQEARPANPAP